MQHIKRIVFYNLYNLYFFIIIKFFIKILIEFINFYIFSNLFLKLDKYIFFYNLFNV
jgi:hypothetical protein